MENVGRFSQFFHSGHLESTVECCSVKCCCIIVIFSPDFLRTVFILGCTSYAYVYTYLSKIIIVLLWQITISHIKF